MGVLKPIDHNIEGLCLYIAPLSCTGVVVGKEYLCTCEQMNKGKYISEVLLLKWEEKCWCVVK